MKLLKNFLAIIVLLNIVVFIWPKQAADSLSHVYPPRVDVNARFIRLNQEIEEEQRAAANNNLIEADSAFLSASGSQCYRLGPFSQATNFEIAQATLFNAGVEYSQGRRSLNRTEVYRVYLGPFKRRAEAVDARISLSNKGVLDHFIRDEPSGDVIVSLGIFTSRETADLGLQQIRSKTDQAELREEVVTLPPADWLYFSLPDRQDIRRQLESIDWGETGAQLGPYACQD